MNASNPIRATQSLLTLLLSLNLTSSALAQPKPATQATQANNQALLQQLPFQDRQDFDDAQRGFIAPLLSPSIIKNSAGTVVSDSNKFSFIQPGSPAPNTVNPSLWRQSQLVNISGLFKVTDRLYQIRNLDLSNMTIIEGNSGIIVVDPLVSTETAKAALALYYQNRPKKPVVAVICSHSHVDHYGGIKGIVSEADVKSGKVKIYAPSGFLEHAVAENVMAGNAMSRRASYMYGNLLPNNETGTIGTGLGSSTSTGTITLIPPTDLITDNESKTIDGLTFEFMMVPDTEAPVEMHWYIPELKALSTAENACHLMHNIYTLRGAQIRSALDWSKSLNNTLVRWGDQAEVLYSMHTWPVWEKAHIKDYLRKQRDTYRYINDQTLHLANEGYTMDEIGDMIELPPSLAKNWSSRGYYGSLNHNVRATYVKYLGFYDGNPATLHRYPPVEASKRYVEFMGGADAVLNKARQYYDKGDYRWVAQVVNHVVFADPNNQTARNLEADALEQLGYQSESGPWRNVYLSGAQELRQGIQKLPAPSTVSVDSIAAMDLDMLFDYLAIKLNGPKASNQNMTLNFQFPDTHEQYVVELENGVLNHTKGIQNNQANSTLSLSRSTFNKLILKQSTLEQEISSGHIQINGDPSQSQVLLSLLDNFEFWFNIVTP